jgi:hypothetical protein
MVPLLTIGLSLIVLAALPASRKPLGLLVVAGFLFALLVGFATADVFLIAAAGVLPVLVGLVLREIVDTFRIASAPRRAARRGRQLERRALEREHELRERQHRREERRRLAA